MALLQQDLVPASGDSLITFDTDTNLEWLSLTKTVNHKVCPHPACPSAR